MPTSVPANNMFIEQSFNYTQYTKDCQSKYGLTPQYDWAFEYFGGKNIDRDFMSASNIVFSNGQLDPWRAGGVQHNITGSSIVAVFIE